MSSAKNANARRQPGERVSKLTDGMKVQRLPRAVNATYGPNELCAWEVEPGVFWIQTTEPEYSRKLEKREDMRRVEMIGINHFHRTFETRGRWRKIRRIIDRFLMSAGDQFSGGLDPQASSKNGGSINVPASANGENNGIFLAEGGQSARQGIAHDASEAHARSETARVFVRLDHIAGRITATENVSLCADEKLTASIELESAIWRPKAKHGFRQV
jgi:hypothetical protein